MAARRSGTQRSIVVRSLAIAALPALVVAIGAFVALSVLSRDTDRHLDGARDRVADEMAAAELSGTAVAITAELDHTVDEHIAETRGMAITPAARAAAGAGTVLAVELGLQDLAAEDLEARFATTRRLPGSAAASELLADVVSRSPNLVGATLTNGLGHTVAFSGPTTDFVHSDEVWWQSAWDVGIDVGAPVMADPLGVPVATIAVRVDDRAGGRPLGVIVTVVDLTAVQEIADRFASDTDHDVTILDATGRLVAETDGDHRADRILADSVHLDFDIGVASDGPVREIETTAVLGVAATSSAVPTLGWAVVVEQSTPADAGSASVLDGLEDDLRAAADRFSVGLLLVGLAAIATAIMLAFVLARGIAKRRPADLSPPAEPPRDPRPAFVNLGRRDRGLLRRQAALLGQLEQAADDHQRGVILARLETIAVRLQRNAENLLALAAEEPPVSASDAIDIAEVIDRAGSVLDDHHRVEVALDPVTVDGTIVADTAHLLAELLENALTFSAPTSSVAVRGTLTADGYRLSVTDDGIGIAGPGLTAANDRLRRPDDFDRSIDARLGLQVVGCLAARHGIDVGLAEVPGGGIVARVTLPLDRIEPPTTDDPAPSPPGSTSTVWPSDFGAVDHGPTGSDRVAAGPPPAPHRRAPTGANQRAR